MASYETCPLVRKHVPRWCFPTYALRRAQLPRLCWGFPDGSVVKNLPANAGDTGHTGLIPRTGKIPCRRKWQPTPVHLPEKSHEQRGQVGYSPWCHKRAGHNLSTKQQHTFSKSINSSRGQMYSFPPTIERRKKESFSLVFLLLVVIQSPLQFSFQETPPST